MSRKIIGVTVGTPTSPAKIAHDIKPDIKAYIDEQSTQLSNALKGSNVGEVVAIYDTSPVEHSMGVKVKSKNQCPETALKTTANGGVMKKLGSCTYDEAEKIITLTGDATSNHAGMYGLPFAPEADKYYTFSCEVRGTTDKIALVGFTTAAIPITLTEEYQKFSMSASGSRINNVRFYLQKGSISGDWIQFRNVQIEEGTTATDYAPYVDINAVKVTVSDGDIVSKQYEVNADGTVDGVTSIYPNMTLSTDTQGAVIDCTYNRDINKAFAELQQAILSLGGNE